MLLLSNVRTLRTQFLIKVGYYQAKGSRFESRGSEIFLIILNVAF